MNTTQTKLRIAIVFAAIAALAAGSAQAAIIGTTTLDVVQANGFPNGGTAGNTVRIVNPANFWSTTATSNADDLWADRAISLFTSTSPSELTRLFELDNTDRTDAPDLRTTVSGLDSGQYSVYLIYITRDSASVGASLEARLGTSGAFTNYDHTNYTDRSSTPATWYVSIALLGTTAVDVTSFSIDVGGSTTNARNDYIGVGYQLIESNEIPTPAALPAGLGLIALTAIRRSRRR